MRNDPRWITAKFAGADRDGNPFPKGARVFYYPLTKTILTGTAADQASREFESQRADENSGGYTG